MLCACDVRAVCFVNFVCHSETVNCCFVSFSCWFLLLKLTVKEGRWFGRAESDVVNSLAVGMISQSNWTVCSEFERGYSLRCLAAVLFC